MGHCQSDIMVDLKIVCNLSFLNSHGSVVEYSVFSKLLYIAIQFLGKKHTKIP